MRRIYKEWDSSWRKQRQQLSTEKIGVGIHMDVGWIKVKVIAVKRRLSGINLILSKDWTCSRSVDWCCVLVDWLPCWLPSCRLPYPNRSLVRHRRRVVRHHGHPLQPRRLLRHRRFLMMRARRPASETARRWYVDCRQKTSVRLSRFSLSDKFVWAEVHHNN